MAQQDAPLGDLVVDTNRHDDKVDDTLPVAASQADTVHDNFARGDGGASMDNAPAAVPIDDTASIQQPTLANDENVNPFVNVAPRQLTLAEYEASRALCAACGNVHAFIEADLPTLKTSETLAASFSPSRRVGHQDERRWRFSDYRRKLLREYFVFSHSDVTKPVVKHMVRPIVTLHEQKPSFIMFRYHEIVKANHPDAEPLDSVSVGQLFLCPHASIATGDHVARLSCTPLERALANADRDVEIDTNLSCKYCPTDIQLSTKPGKLIARIWHDFGTADTTPQSKQWLSLVVSPKNNEFVGPTVPHAKGSIQRRFDVATEIQGVTSDYYIHEDHQNRLTYEGLRDAGHAVLSYRVHGRREAAYNH